MGVDVGVYLRGAYVFVAEHALDDAQVGAALEQVGGEGVAKGVGTDSLREPNLLGQGLDNVEHGDARHLFLEVGTDEEVVLVAGLDVYRGAVGKLGGDFGNGPLRDGHEALLAALALDLDEPLVEVEVGELEVAGLGHA